MPDDRALPRPAGRARAMTEGGCGCASVLFLMRYPLEKDDNLKIKFDGQMAAVRAMGHEARLIGWGP